MLTRLKVSGFKNLVDVDIRFGPFTCIAGANGVGKSNLFDAIRFLSALADNTLMDAALSVRGEGSGQLSDVRSLFHCVGDEYASEMSFEAEMIILAEGVDDLRQPAKATTTFVRYAVTLGYLPGDTFQSLGSLELLKEELDYIKRTEAKKHLPFPQTKEWSDSAVTGSRTSIFISTSGEGKNRVINLHADGSSRVDPKLKSRGRPLARLAHTLPRTVLSVTNAAESPTALLARREMQSWRLLQLEPSALRKPDEFTAPVRLSANGAHLPAALYRLANSPGNNGHASAAATSVYQQIGNRLAQLIDDVADLWIDRDDKREILTLRIRGKDGATHAARALSDGTLRFLALAVIEKDPQAQGVICLEEPENGIHPERIAPMLELLQDIAVDTESPVADDNPLRQVLVNTHSPVLVQQVTDDDSLLVAVLEEMVKDGRRFKRVVFKPLPGGWRQKADPDIATATRGELLAYLNPVDRPVDEDVEAGNHHPPQKSRRIIDRPDLQPLLPGFDEA